MADNEQERITTRQPSRHLEAAGRVLDAALLVVDSDDLGEAWLARELAPHRLAPLGAEDPIAATLLDQGQHDKYEMYVARRNARHLAADAKPAADLE